MVFKGTCLKENVCELLKGTLDYFVKGALKTVWKER